MSEYIHEHHVSTHMEENFRVGSFYHKSGEERQKQKLKKAQTNERNASEFKANSFSP